MEVQVRCLLARRHRTCMSWSETQTNPDHRSSSLRTSTFPGLIGIDFCHACVFIRCCPDAMSSKSAVRWRSVFKRDSSVFEDLQTSHLYGTSASGWHWPFVPPKQGTYLISIASHVSRLRPPLPVRLHCSKKPYTCTAFVLP